MRVLIAGGRDFADRGMFYRTMDQLHEEHTFTLLIHGTARGADRIGGEWSEERGIDALACPADWKRYGQGAGPKRNRQLLDEKPELLVAFPGGKAQPTWFESQRRRDCR